MKTTGFTDRGKGETTGSVTDEVRLLRRTVNLGQSTYCSPHQSDRWPSPTDRPKLVTVRLCIVKSSEGMERRWDSEHGPSPKRAQVLAVPSDPPCNFVDWNQYAAEKWLEIAGMVRTIIQNDLLLPSCGQPVTTLFCLVDFTAFCCPIVDCCSYGLLLPDCGLP